MRGIDLSCGAEVEYRGQRYVITNNVLSHSEVEARNVSTGQYETLLIAEIEEPRSEADAVVVSDLSTIESHRYEEARRRQGAIEALLALPRRSKQTVRERAADLGVSVSALYGWMRSYRMDDRLTTLLPIKPEGGRGKSRLEPEVERVIQLALEKHLSPQQLSVRDTYREVRRLCRAAKIKPPHENTVRARVQSIPNKVLLRKRGHRKEASDIYEPKPGQFVVSKPLEVVQIDHTTVDVTLVDEEHRLPLRRPYITVCFDVFSRMVLGFYISFDNPGAMGTGLAIARSILPK